ncbi:protein NRT1/ PTR FAMILY 5.10-like [Aristolochia californica]|uniref:protein NRT1/ PTR FAMILY 5.10-like n=1 Tax=Aristolochia californica TaxID=171875 RepID=UPI0035DF894E
MDVNPTSALLEEDTVERVVDHRGHPVSRSKAGGWRSVAFIMAAEMAERFAYNGIRSNLINYLTGPFGKPVAEAAASVNIWSGCIFVFPLLGAFLGDFFLGRYWMVLIASLLYVLGTSLLTLSALSPSLHPTQCPEQEICPPPTQFQTFLLFTSLYLVAIAQGGHKPCVQAFGADQFDAQNPAESKSRSSFFNWLNFFVCLGSTASIIIVTYIQENKSWGLGFSLPCISMVIAFALFLLGTPTYRYSHTEKQSALIKSREDVGAAIEQRVQQAPVPSAGDRERLQIKITSEEIDDLRRSAWSGLQVEAKQVLQLMPIWATCIFYGVVEAQPSSLFTKQGGIMDRQVGRHFQIPAAAFQSSITFMAVLLVPIYDRIIVPIMRFFTNLPSGITMLQRIGIGLFLSIATMVVAAVVERRRLVMVRELGLADDPDATVPMSVWWLLPQYTLNGVAQMFMYTGSLEFFYDQMPDGLRSVGVAFFMTIFGIGSFLSGILISVVDMASSAHGESWFDTNLNRAHLDYFYWLIAALCTIGFGLFIYFAKSYVYTNKPENREM